MGNFRLLTVEKCESTIDFTESAAVFSESAVEFLKTAAEFSNFAAEFPESAAEFTGFTAESPDFPTNPPPLPMPRLLFSLLLLLPLRLFALTVPEGTYHFENAVTQYTRVKFLYGAAPDGVTHIVSLAPRGGTLWTFAIPATAEAQTHYFFADTTLPDGEYPESIATLKDRIAGERGERRTQTFKDADNVPMIPGATFVPAAAELYATGSWQADPATLASGTLPILVVRTDDGSDIMSKADYTAATAYLLPPAAGEGAAPALGDAANPVPLLIRGRGNYTWIGFEKKPYRLKFADKQQMLGLPPSRHFALLAGADDDLGQLRNALGFELARRLVAGWTPRLQPLEVVLNGRYIGLYFLAETIRVAANRVDIAEQPDNLAVGDVSGGWLVEVDNYDTSPHIAVELPDKSQPLWVTYHSPKALSALQRDYLQQQFTLIRDALYHPATASVPWQALLDVRTMAEVYVVRELLQDEEGFHGSFYFHKDAGGGARWQCGPVWDFGNAYRNALGEYIWGRPNFECFLIDRLYAFPEFREAAREAFGRYYHTLRPDIEHYVDSLAGAVSAAAVYDFRAWPSYGTDRMADKAARIIALLRQKTEWLAVQWGTEWSAVAPPAADAPEAVVQYFDLRGRMVSAVPAAAPAHPSAGGGVSVPPLPPGVYVRRTVSRGRTLSVQRVVLGVRH